MKLAKRQSAAGSTLVVILVLALLAGVGVFGYWMGRRGHAQPTPAERATADVSPVPAPSPEPAGALPAEPASPVPLGSAPVSNEVPVATESGTASNRIEAAAPAALSSVATVSATQRLSQAEALLGAGKRVEARDAYRAALEAGLPPESRQSVEDKLGKLDVELVRHPWPLPEKVDHVVVAGDAIKAIAQKYGTTVDLIVESNGLKRPDHIEPGDRLRVFSGKLAVTVNKTRNDLLVTSQGRFFKRYRVGTGKYGKTPVGTFVVSDRIKDPPWWRNDGKVVPFGDKENILGTRWMALKATGSTPEIKGYGIHGTWDADTIGKAESAGCIRLRNEDVEELFLLLPVGTAVVIEE